MSAPSVPVLTAEQSAAWDTRAREHAAIPSRALMEAAGRAVASATADMFPERLREGVIVVAGPGNNGGDGWVVARALRAVGVAVTVVDPSQSHSADCEANRALAVAEGVPVLGGDAAWPTAGIVVDALLGTGAKGAPRGAIGSLAARIMESGRPVAAVDGPTGLDLSTGEAHGPVRADLTVTFGGARRGHLLQRLWCGRIVVVDIGFPPPDPSWPLLVTDAWARNALPGFEATMHKGRRGRLLVIGGAAGMAGAAIHAARSAFHLGAGLVKLALDPASVAAAQAQIPDALTVPTALTGELERELEDAIDWADAIAVGPGLGRGPTREALVRAVLERATVPVVIDADALHVGTEVLRAGDVPRVLTPHPGEFAAAFPSLKALASEDRFAAPREAAAQLDGSGHTVVVLKGVPTVLADGDGHTRVVAAGNPGLATGGSGDLLTGAIGVLLSRGLNPLEAASLGAQTLGRAADLAVRTIPVRSLRPENVAEAFPELWRRWGEPAVARPPVLATLDPPALE